MSQESLASTSGAETQTEYALDDFSALLQKEFKPNTDNKKSRIEAAVKTLAQQALSDAAIISDDVFSTLDAMKAAIDRTLAEQVNLIIHHEEFQKLESAWRGLSYLVYNTSTGKDLKIRVLNISKDETRRMLRQYRDAAWDQSPLFKKIYEAEFGQLGGEPFGAFVCDYYFDYSAPDIEVMRGLAKIGSAAHAPFIAAAGSQMLNMDSWQDLANPRDLAKQFEAPEYMAWRSFRESNDSRYMALTLPRFLGRPPYGAATEPVEEFAFEEDVASGDHDRHLWLNAAYALGGRITESFATYGWVTRIRGVESGGTVENLPTATFPTDEGGLDAKCPTEIAISDRREAELSKAGFMALIHRKNTDQATFIGAQTVHNPKKFEDSDATASAALSARLPYIFASTRFAHYLKCMVRDWIGGSREAPQLQTDLTNWLTRYIDGNPSESTDAFKATHPLKEGSVQIVADPDNPGQYRGIFRFVPHYQLEGIDVSMSMVSRLPSSN